MINKLDEKEVLRYMGYPADYIADDALRQNIKTSSELLIQAARPKYTAQLFDIVCDENNVKLKGAEVILSGKSISEHLKDCDKCVIMAATLGIEADRIIRRAQLSSVSEALVLDACATTYIEAFCDRAEEEIKQKYGPCNFRFSPGYGDFPISQQKEILSLLMAEKKIGLCVNSSNLLTPCKSVTAVMGVTDKCSHTSNKCELCPNKERCAFSRYEK